LRHVGYAAVLAEVIAGDEARAGVVGLEAVEKVSEASRRPGVVVGFPHAVVAAVSVGLVFGLQALEGTELNIPIRRHRHRARLLVPPLVAKNEEALSTYSVEKMWIDA